MEPKKKPTAAQLSALMEFMERHPEVANGSMKSLDKEEFEEHWRELTTILNSMGGVVKPVEKWKLTWRDLKVNNRKRALKQQQSGACDTSMGPSGDYASGDASTDAEYTPPTKKASFDEEIIKLEREKLQLEREYKAQKIDVLSRIASALEKIATKKDKT